MRSREAHRDSRDFDTSSLHENHHGKALSRDYTAHWHRWSFARRMIKKTDHVIEIGCGPERPLWRMLFHGSFAVAKTYTGVDLNKLSGLGMTHKSSLFLGEFDFTSRWKEILKHFGKAGAPEIGSGGYDVAVHMEVIEHMKVEHGKKLLKGCFELLRPGGIMLMSTPVYDGVHHAANHIHEYEIPELQKLIEKAGFIIDRRFGTFMNVRDIGNGARNEFIGDGSDIDNRAIKSMAKALGDYYDNDALATIFAPLYPDASRNNLWVCRKPSA